MAIRTIRTDEDPVLRKNSRVVDELTSKIDDLIGDMIDTMYEADGIGLAAVQVGILKRIIVIDLYDDQGVKVIINPEIVEEKGEQMEVEGCLSVPEKAGMVKRPMWVKVEGLNRKGEKIVIEGEALMARALCHEIDHLNGVLFTDIMIEEPKL